MFIKAWQALATLEKRYVVCFACFLATCCAYIERTGFSVAFTAMCAQAGAPERVKGMVMGAFYWGYGFSQIPGGYLAQRFGGRRVILVSFAGWSAVSFLTPRSAHAATALYGTRVLVGIFQGLLIPSVHTILSEWVLPHERAKATSLCTSGMYLGSAAAIQVLPGVARAAGDPSVVFRLVAGLGAAWLALWAAIGADVRHRGALIPVSLPAKPRHPEPAGSASGSGPAANGEAASGHDTRDMKKTAGPTPWRALLRSSAVWAIVTNNFTFHYAFYIVMNWMPTYFSALLGTDLDAAGVGKPLPYLVMFTMSNAGGWAGDALIGRGWTVAAARKAVNTAGFAAAAVLLLAMPAVASVRAGIAVLSLCLGALGLSRGGFSVNHMDIAPRYAGIVMGISNTAGTLAGLVGVPVTGFILEAAGGAAARAGWLHAHLVAVVMAFVGVLFFMSAAKGRRLFP